MSLQFELPANLKAEQFIAKLSNKAAIDLVARHYCIRTYYDSFDWRLWTNGRVCEFNRSKTSAVLTLHSIANGRAIASAEMAEIPPFPKQFMPGKLRGTLQSILEMRALLAVCTLEYEAFHLNLMNKDNKIVLRLMIEDYELCKSRVWLQPVKGYELKAKGIIDLLTGDLGLTATDKPVLQTALQLQGRKPNDYSTKLKFDFEPSLRADTAVKIIYSRLLKTIKDNEPGTLADIDSEFLHDYRVAVRRTRAGLGRLKGLLPDDIAAYFADFFSWLGQVTGPTRDLDVYLLHFEDYKCSLPEAIREDLNPLYDFLLEAKLKARQDLVHQLKSSRYIKTLLEWEQILKQQTPLNTAGPHAHLTVKELADTRIWKVYQRALEEGEAITPDSPPESLHGLRKTCKKLRYLMEFFQHLYAPNKIKRLLKDLKALQDVLGDFQDFDVQERRLRLFSEKMMQNSTPAKTFLAIGILIQALDANKGNARKHFASRFERFAQEKNHSAFKSLFAGED